KMRCLIVLRAPMAKRRQPAHREGHRGLQHIDVEVGAKLREYRTRAGLSQTELGAKTGVTFQQIQKYEKGTNAIATARLPAICEALDITPNDLYGTLYTSGKAREPAPQLSVFAAKLALAVDQLPNRLRLAIAELVRNLTGVEFSEA
ncbi:MAG TPA: helix-turn-helix transcriptional regulator, partial [Blastocatellia bacterium]